MILTSIQAANLKGRTFKYALGPGTMIVGPNFSGKTAIIEAIRLALMGYIPEVGKLPKSTWELSSAADMQVMATFDNKSQIVRLFSPNGKPVVSTDGAFPNTEGLPLLHADHYFSLTDNERTEYVFDRIRLPETFSAAGIIAELQRISLEEDHSEAIERVKQAVIQELHARFYVGAHGSLSIQEALSQSVEDLREKFTYWNRRAKETQGAVTVLTELKLKQKEVRAANPKIEQDIAHLQKKIDAVHTDKGRVTAERNALDRAAGRRKQLRKALDADRIDYPATLAKKQAEIDELEKQVAPEPPQSEIKHAQARVKELTTDIAAIDGKVEITDKSIGEINTQMTQLKDWKECPVCHSHSKGWKDNMSDSLLTQKIQAEERISNMSKTRDSLQKQLRDACEAVEEMTDTQTKNARIKTQVATAAIELATIQRAQADDAEKWQRYEAELKELPQGDAAKHNQQLADIGAELTRIDAEMSALQYVKKQETKVEQDILRATEAEAEHIDAKAHLTVIKAMATLLKEKRTALVGQAFGKLLQVANMLDAGILQSPLVMQDNTIGRFVDGNFVPHRVFSGTEKALTYISIATALSADSPLKLVILDEFGRLDDGNQINVLARLLNLVNEKVIDQFIVVGTEAPHPRDFNLDRLTLIKT